MNQKFFIGLMLAGWLVLTPGLVVAQGAEPLKVDAERLRIERQRSSYEAIFLQAEQACYARFAVSDCLRRARMERRTAFSELRRQELVLNDLDRQSKAMTELSRIQDNVSDQQKDAMERQGQPILKAP
jgi:hypothetical protein